jgi:ribonuclease E
MRFFSAQGGTLYSKCLHGTSVPASGHQARRAAKGGVSQAKNRVFLLGDLHTENAAKQSVPCDIVVIRLDILFFEETMTDQKDAEQNENSPERSAASEESAKKSTRKDAGGARKAPKKTSPGKKNARSGEAAPEDGETARSETRSGTRSGTRRGAAKSAAESSVETPAESGGSPSFVAEEPKDSPPAENRPRGGKSAARSPASRRGKSGGREKEPATPETVAPDAVLTGEEDSGTFAAGQNIAEESGAAGAKGVKKAGSTAAKSRSGGSRKTAGSAGTTGTARIGGRKKKALPDEEILDGRDFFEIGAILGLDASNFAPAGTEVPGIPLSFPGDPDADFAPSGAEPLPEEAERTVDFPFTLDELPAPDFPPDGDYFVPAEFSGPFDADLEREDRAGEEIPGGEDGAEIAGREAADFPTGFGDAGPEDFFAPDGVEDEGETGEAAPEQGERRRHGRSRRGRGRKKAAALAAAAAVGQNAAAAVGEEGADTASASPDATALFAEVREQYPADDEAEDGYGYGGDDAEDLFDNAPESERKATGKAGRRKMFVSVLTDEQVEVVITEEGHVQEYYVEMLHQAKTKGNIYKAVVNNVDPNLQAAFVGYGAVKNGFLQIDEVHPEYYVVPHDAAKGRKYPPIQKVLKPGQELLVQVVKEPAGTKGAFLTTYLSMPGRFLVLTPGREQIGVSRKVENEGERSRLREMLEGLTPGPGLGVIVRTVSMGASKTSLQRDLQFLKRTWKEVRTRGTTDKAPCLVYQEMDLTARAVRDYLTEAIGEIWIDDETTAAAVTEVAEALFPRKQNLVRVHKDGSSTLFERFNIQRQLDQIHSREVSLPSGGRLVIDPTEALTAIDINSGRSGGKSNFEDMAYRTNMEAARMIPLQLRLRDIGGQIVADFIEMRDKAHWREVEKTLRGGMKVDRARYDVGKIGPFGMLEIVRQRLGSSAISVSTEPCPCCNGTGVRRNMEWQSQQALRDILRALRNAQVQKESVYVQRLNSLWPCIC